MSSGCTASPAEGHLSCSVRGRDRHRAQDCVDRVVISLGSVPQRATARWDSGCSAASPGAALIPTPTSMTDPSAPRPHQLWVLSLFFTVSTERQQWPLVSGMGAVGACGPLSAVFCPFCDWNVRVFTVGLPDLLLNFVGHGVCRRRLPAAAILSPAQWSLLPNQSV